VQFRVLNLLDSFDCLGQFDVIFCRNVLMYFDQAVKHDVLTRLTESLAPDGYLVMGSAETVPGRGTPLQEMRNPPGVFRATRAQATRPARD
jgi:chemotaxis protein methyltransferase CheR